MEKLTQIPGAVTALEPPKQTKQKFIDVKQLVELWRGVL